MSYVIELGQDEDGNTVTETRCGEEFHYCEPADRGVTYCDQPDGHDGPHRRDEYGRDEAGHEDGDEECPE